MELFQEIDRHNDSIYVLQHELEVMVPQHKHRQGHILVVLSGVATVNVERSAYYIPYGYFVWIPAEKSHRISFEEKKIKLLNVYYPAPLASSTFFEEVGVYPMPSILYHVMQLIEGKTAAYTPEHWRYELLATTLHILPHIVPSQRLQLRLPTSDHPIIARIVAKIQQEYQQNLTAHYVAEECGLSVRTLSRYLRTELDVSFVQYVRTYRILMAIRKMVKQQDSISNIAYSVGYDSLTAFSNSFFKVTGMRPSQFKNLL